MYAEKEYARAQTRILADLCISARAQQTFLFNTHNKPRKKQIELVRIWRGVVAKCGHWCDNFLRIYWFCRGGLY